MSNVDDATNEAAQAAYVAGVSIAPVATPDELDELRATMTQVWGPEVVPPRNLLRGMALGGGCLLLARRAGQPVGFALGWLGWDGGVHLHSHQVGVRSEERGSGVGLALKLAQRAECLEHGIDEMRWTFDPLLRANATFNLVRLGATVTSFLPHCYGDRRDAFNTGDTTDRVEVSWRLDRPVGSAPVEVDDRTVIEIPADYHALRAADPATAAAHRRRVADALSAALERGVPVLGLAAPGYVLGEAS